MPELKVKITVLVPSPDSAVQGDLGRVLLLPTHTTCDK